MLFGALLGYATGFLVLAHEVEQNYTREEIVNTIRITSMGVAMGIILFYLFWVFVASKWE